MKRTKQKKTPSAILTGDWHLREDQPTCRTDDFWDAQWRKVAYIQELQQKYQCPVYHAGDLFDHWKSSPYLLSTALKYLPNKFCTIFGNHDLPNHNLELYYKSGVEVLSRANKLEILPGAHWGSVPKQESFLFNNRKVLVWHVMTWTGEKPWPGCEDWSAKEILKQYPDFDLIITGHNHKSFVEEYEGRLLVNPGSLTRMSADQIDHEPCVYFWYENDNSVEKVTLPYGKEVISREHIEKKQQKDERIQAFVDKLNTDWTVEVSFKHNLEQFLKANTINSQTEQIIWQSMEG